MNSIGLVPVLSGTCPRAQCVGMLLRTERIQAQAILSETICEHQHRPWRNWCLGTFLGSLASWIPLWMGTADLHHDNIGESQRHPLHCRNMCASSRFLFGWCMVSPQVGCCCSQWAQEPRNTLICLRMGTKACARPMAQASDTSENPKRLAAVFYPKLPRFLDSR